MPINRPSTPARRRRRARAALGILAALVAVLVGSQATPVISLFISNGSNTVNTTAYSPYARAVLNDSPIAYWPLDETSGTVAYDRTAGARHGTYLTDGTGSATPGGAPMPVNARSAAQISLGQVTFPTLPLPATAGAKVTVDFWMLLPSGSVGCMPFTFGNNGVDLFWDTSTNKFGFNTFNADNWGITPPSNFFGRPVHVAAVFENASSSVADFQANDKLYVNGVQQTLTQSGTPFLKTLSATTVASGNPGATNWRLPSGSLISDVAIYNGELSAAQIQNHYNTGHIYASVVAQTPNLLGYWRLDEPSGTTAWDFSGNKNSGNYTNDAGGTVATGGAGMTRGSAGSAVFNGGTIVMSTIPVPQTAGTVITVEFWMNIPSEPSVVTIMFALSGRYVEIAPVEHLIGFGTANSDVWGASDSGLFGRTVFVAATMKNWNGTISDFQTNDKLYIDGSLQTLTQVGTPATTGLTAYGDVSGYVGQTSGTTYRMNSGSRISDVAVYNGELSAATIQNHFLNGKP